ncbi:MAG: site-2 protease family protein, partial [Luminiphilus sp.]
FLALLSVSLGALNLLPIPVLDGGAIVFCAFEALLGKPLPERVQMVGYQVGVALVLSIMVFALYNDVAKL